MPTESIGNCWNHRLSSATRFNARLQDSAPFAREGAKGREGGKGCEGAEGCDGVRRGATGREERLSDMARSSPRGLSPEEPPRNSVPISGGTPSPSAEELRPHQRRNSVPIRAVPISGVPISGVPAPPHAIGFTRFNTTIGATPNDWTLLLKAATSRRSTSSTRRAIGTHCPTSSPVRAIAPDVGRPSGPPWM